MMLEAKTIEAVAGLKARYDKPYSPADRELIKELYRVILGKTIRNTGCQNCYHDAVIELYLFTRKETKKDMAQLKAGAIIACPQFHNGQIFTNENLTDEVAREYLAAYPQRTDLFAVLPPKVKEPKKAKEPKKSAEAETEPKE